MSFQSLDPNTLFARRLASANILGSHALSPSLGFRLESLQSGTKIFKDGEVVSDCCIILSGYACRYQLAKDGGRQIISFHMAGDFLDVRHLWVQTADHTLQTITEAYAAFISVEALREVIHEQPSVGFALWNDSLNDSSLFRECIVNLGRRNAKARVAHMLCEFILRAEAAGLGTPTEQIIPMTQEQIGDATGLTPVHVNRMLRALREDGAVQGAGRDLKIVDWRQLKEIAGFMPKRLHLAGQSAFESSQLSNRLAKLDWAH